MDYRPSRFQVSKVYAKRAIRWRRNSAPFISGDSFADFADVVINPPKFRGNSPSLNEIKRASIIFIRSHDLKGFLAEYKGMLSAKVIISGNSDHEFHNYDLEIPAKTRLLLLQNSYLLEDSRIKTIPIGIENFRFGVNGHPNVIRQLSSIPDKKVLIGPYSNTHPVRSEVISRFENFVGPWTILTTRKTPEELNYIANTHEFTAAVRGNGVDTHRLWETLYRGRMPICQSDDWLRSLGALNLPMLEVTDWDPREVNELLLNYSFESFDPLSLEALWMPYWERMIRKMCL